MIVISQKSLEEIVEAIKKAQGPLGQKLGLDPREVLLPWVLKQLPGGLPPL